MNGPLGNDCENRLGNEAERRPVGIEDEPSQGGVAEDDPAVTGTITKFATSARSTSRRLLSGRRIWPTVSDSPMAGILLTTNAKVNRLWSVARI